MTTTTPIRQLDSRRHGATEVNLLWDPNTHRVSIQIKEPNRVAHCVVPATEARHAFIHPNLYV